MALHVSRLRQEVVQVSPILRPAVALGWLGIETYSDARCGRRILCSVACVRRHKTEMGCQGKRCKTKFVSLTSFTTEHLLNGKLVSC